MNWSTVFAILIGFLGLDILIIFHELGHFFAARACGIRVQRLAFGLGPAIVKWQHGETEFRINIIPFGGATTMCGQDDLKRALQKKQKRIEDCEDGSIYAATPWHRIITYLSGPLANILFAVICFIIILLMPVLHVDMNPEIRLTADVPEYASLPCAAKDAGLESGDWIYSVGGKGVQSWEELEQELKNCSDQAYVFIVTRRGLFTVSPVDGKFGLLPAETFTETVTPGKKFFQTLGPAFTEVGIQISTFSDAITGIFLGRNKVGETLGGTLSASEHVGAITRNSFSISFNTGIRVALYLLASVSISLGIANMLPITALDGGLILISVAEIIAGHTLHPKTYVVLQIAGLATVLILIPVLRIFL